VGRCRLCGRESVTVSDVLGVCVDCLRTRPSEALRIAMRAHARSRKLFGLRVSPPRGGLRCGLCARGCEIPPGETGYCGLVRNVGGRLSMPGPEYGVLDYYYDPIPTNCVADWVCPASTGRGYPRYAVEPRAEVGYYNLAVFYGSCSLDCLFCQNWQWRKYPSSGRLVSVDELVRAAINGRVTCISFFGGDPSSQVTHALRVAWRAIEEARKRGRVMRICWETSGQISPNLLDAVIRTSLVSGGIIKFDLKAWTPSVYRALTGGDVGAVLENFRRVARHIGERPEVPLLVASILLVPGYVDEYEVDKLTRFIAETNPGIPTRLLAYHPDYLLSDLPPTSRRHAEEALRIARENGLTNVALGNEWLLSDAY